MEATGLAVSLGSIPAIIQSCVACFEYIQLGKAFGQDFETGCLQLDTIRLRLSRWGESIGVGSDLTGVVALDGSSISEAHVQKGEEILGQILALLQNAERVSDKFKSRHTDAQAIDVEHGLAGGMKPLHTKMRGLCRLLQRGASLGLKAKWALYEKSHLDGLVNDIQKLVRDLEDLFPAAAESRQTICDKQAEQLKSEEALPALIKVVKIHDPELNDSLARLLTLKDSTQNVINNNHSKIANQLIGSQMLNGGQTFTL